MMLDKTTQDFRTELLTKWWKYFRHIFEELEENVIYRIVVLTIERHVRNPAWITTMMILIIGCRARNPALLSRSRIFSRTNSLRWTGTVTTEDFVSNAEVHRLVIITWKSSLVSACAAVAGMTIVAAYREFVIAGSVMAEALIPSASATGAAMASLHGSLMLKAFQRLGLDMLLIIQFGMLFITWKQATVHRRSPIV